MKLIDEMIQAKKDATIAAQELVRVRAREVASKWRSLLIEDAKSGKREAYFTEMTSHLYRDFGRDISDNVTIIYLETIAQYFRDEGIKVSKPYKIQNCNDFQARIDLTW